MGDANQEGPLVSTQPECIPVAPDEPCKVSDNSFHEDEGCSDERMDEDETDLVASQKTTCIKTLTESYTTIHANLQSALAELSQKEGYRRQLEEETSHQRERNWLLEEKIRSMTERLCYMVRAVEGKERRQEALFEELVDAKWKLHEAKVLVEKVKKARESFQQKSLIRKEEIGGVENVESQEVLQRQQIQDEIKRLEDYRARLQSGDTHLCAILTGTKMMELEQRKRAIREAFNERGVRTETMYVDIDEKTELLGKRKQSLQNAEKHYKSQIRRLKMQLETQHRLQRNVDYLQAKKIYGANVPAPPPWKGMKYD